MSLPPNRTPFDDDLVTNPNAPRHTQPLPAQRPSQAPPAPHNTQSSPGSPLPSGPSTVSGVSPLPRQIIPDDDALAKTTTLSARRVPMSVIVGLAMVGGAIGVVMLSSAFGRLAPRPDSPGVITAEQEQARAANQNSPFQAAPTTPRVVVVPPRTSKPDRATQANPDASNSNPNDASTDDAPASGTVVPNDQAGRDVASGSERNSTTSSRNTDDTTDSDTPDSSAPRNQNLSSGGSRNASRDNNDGGNDNGSATNDGATSARGIEYSNRSAKPRYVERRRSYSIRPPAGFQIAQRGRRTVWQGPGRTQFLVEVGDSEGASPREGWEQLEKGLQRKYGSRYRSHGIRDTTVNGREAAIWEFELQTPKGRVRKMDVAVHDGKNGYAVLGSAPAENFEDWRPSFERAIGSLQIDSNQSNDNGSNESGQTDSSATAEGY